MSDILISICIPAYKRTDFLKRLLDSIAIQTYRNFEVIVTDDSPNNEVKDLCEQYASSFQLFYFKNPANLNTPENWNEAIRKAHGDWIKLIHDDDWLSDENSLAIFADAINNNPECSFIFSAYSNFYEDTGRKKQMFIKPFWERALEQNVNILIADNIIGPPSVTLHKNDKTTWYDRNMKYIVDIDFYIRYLQSHRYCYISESLINVGINSAQVTKYTFGVAEVHLKEALILLDKTGSQQLKNIMVFDGWWRLIRNFGMKDVKQLRLTGYNGHIPDVIIEMMRFQKQVPSRLLKQGPFSKSIMLLCYSVLRGRRVIS